MSMPDPHFSSLPFRFPKPVITASPSQPLELPPIEDPLPVAKDWPLSDVFSTSGIPATSADLHLTKLKIVTSARDKATFPKRTYVKSLSVDIKSTDTEVTGFLSRIEEKPIYPLCKALTTDLVEEDKAVVSPLNFNQPVVNILQVDPALSPPESEALVAHCDLLEPISDETGLPYVSVLVDRVPRKFLIDTGASVCVLGRDFINAQGFQRYVVPGASIRAVGKTSIEVYGCLTLYFQLHGTRYSHTFLVADVNQCILGYDFFKANRLLISTYPPALLPPLRQAIDSSDYELNALECIHNFETQKEYVLKSGVPLKLGIRNITIDSFFDQLQDKFPDVFTSTHTYKDEHGITFKVELSAPYKSPYIYPVPFNYRQDVEDYIEEMCKLGIMSPSTSEYRAPAVIVKRADGRIRFCVDFRALNKVTKPNNYTLPNIGVMKSSIKGKFFSVLDLKDGFYQIPIDPESIPYTAVSVPSGTYVYNRMPFGLRNAPPVFQRFMSQVVRGLEHCQVYIDDVIVYSDTIQDHIIHLTAFIERAAQYGLTVNWVKTHLFQLKVKYLGFEFDANGYRQKPEIMPKVRDFPAPHDKKGIMKFMGIVNYYRDNIPSLAEVSHPLYELLKKYKRFEWTDEHQSSFDQVKALIADNITLTPIEPGVPFELYTDASQHAVGAALLQKNRVVSFYSKHLNPLQQKQSATMRESYALIAAVRHYNVYLIGNAFTVYTDHKPLVQWFKMKPLTDAFAKQIVKLQGLTFEIKYVEGDKNVLADMLSRPHDVAKATLEQFHAAFKKATNVLTDNYIATDKFDEESIQLNNVEFLSTFDWVKSEQNSKVLSEYRIPEGKIVDIEGSYFYDEPPQPKLIVPPECTKSIVKDVHNFGHFGLRRCVTIVKMFYYWPSIRKDMANFCKFCETCQLKKKHAVKSRSLVKFPVTSRFRTVHMDLVGPLKRTKRSREYILTMMDRFSRWLVAVPLTNIRAETVAQTFYERWVCDYGIPDYIVTDQGSQFESALMERLCKIMDVHRNRTTPYHPQSNGMIERAHSTMKQTLRCFADKFPSWDTALPTAVLAMRTAVNEHGISPSLVVYGEHIAIPGLFVSPNKIIDETTDILFVRQLQTHWLQVRDFILENDKVLSGRDTLPETSSLPYDRVWVREPRFQGSLDFKAKGPYKVIGYEYPVVIILVDNTEQRVNIDRTAPAYIMPGRVFDDPIIQPNVVEGKSNDEQLLDGNQFCLTDSIGEIVSNNTKSSSVLLDDILI